MVSERDDIWAAGHLLFLVTTGKRLTHSSQLAASPDLDSLLRGVFGPPDHRPTALDLLSRLLYQDPVPRGIGADPLHAGRDRFFAIRAQKHPGAAPPGFSGPGPGSQQFPPAAPAPARPQDPRSYPAPRSRPAPREASRSASRRRRGWPTGLAMSSLVLVLAGIGLVMGVLR
jgi:hypothetical protein